MGRGGGKVHEGACLCIYGIVWVWRVCKGEGQGQVKVYAGKWVCEGIKGK